ncbi:DUF3857 domain-containing protein [Lacinutrix sp. Bg11-31]|uniref:DUF3857 domain-containing protein n=1 Tax=Lacinutrix sp. Bg11-31 TaxID=2057808 RepID=UPI000C319B06|nr:DUF3857 domain-containing protein [Lacinutrix sp. Bg11-31]AUC83536.1 hypothetical protein CW733_15930 [Lacinutrix sp. Bg11-31]
MNIKPNLLITCYLFLFSVLSLNAQDESLLNSNTIPISLKTNANAIVRLDYTQIEISSIKKYRYSKKRIVTIINEEGNKKIDASVGYDSGISIHKLQAIIYDAFGNQVKKIRKSDFKDVSAVSNFSLYEDSRVKYMQYTPTNYPYTVVFEYEFSTNNTAYIPSWKPLEGYSVSTEKNQFDVIYDVSVGINTLEKNFEGYTIVNKSKEGFVSYTASNLSALKYEAISPLLKNITPQVLITPVNFHYEGYTGKTDDWKNLGKWMHDEMLQNRTELPVKTKETIIKLVEGIEDPIEKAKLVYKYVQDNTRYISVQEGIGGIQPIAAAQVDEVKYGDCKGLTNYTKALLDVVDVKSNYTRVYASSKNQVDINKDFVTFLGQTNHVILNIPTPQGNVWLECTSQTSPFNYNGGFTDDRDVFVISPEGGEIVHTKIYTAQENTKETKAKVQLEATGNIKAQVEIISQGVRYDNHYYIENELEKDQKLYYKEYFNTINNLEINAINFDNNKDEIVFTEKLDVKITRYASKAGERILLKPNIFNVEEYVPPRYKKRNLPFQINRGKVTINTFEITIPETLQVEALQDAVTITNKFGEYHFSITEKDKKTLVFQRKLKLKKGQYNKEDYKEFRDFLLQIVKHDKSKIVLKNKK